MCRPRHSACTHLHVYMGRTSKWQQAPHNSWTYWLHQFIYKYSTLETLIINVDSYIYPGQRYSTREKKKDKEIRRRITAGWTAFAKHRDIFKSYIGTCLKRQVYNPCVLSAMTYGAETWALTTQAKNKLAAAQTKMEKSMLNITYRDSNTNIWVRKNQKT